MTETGLTLSFSTFGKCRDRNTVQTCLFLKRLVCLCRPHANMSMMLETVSALPRSTTQLVGLSDDEIKEGLQSIPRHLVAFKMWDKEVQTYKNRPVSHTVLNKVKMSKEAFVDKFLLDMVEFCTHHDRVQKQYGAVRTLKEVFPADHVICQMDYSENWNTSFMHEIQSAFYRNDQLTLHPMVVHYRQQDSMVSTLCFVGVSKVTTHAFPTMLAFLTQLLAEVKEEVPELEAPSPRHGLAFFPVPESLCLFHADAMR